MPVGLLKRNLFKVIGLGILAILGVGVLASIYLPEYTRIRELQKRKLDLQGEIIQLKRQVSDLARKNKLVKEKDSYFLEKIAREHLGVIREDEAIVDFTPIEKPAGNVAPRQ